MISGYSLTADSKSVYITPCSVNSFFMLWYTISESYCAPTPANASLSASGIPNFSKVFFISSGTSFQFAFISVFGLTYVAILLRSISLRSGPHVGKSNLLYVSNAFSLISNIQSGSSFLADISLITSSVKPNALYSELSLFLMLYIFSILFFCSSNCDRSVLFFKFFIPF